MNYPITLCITECEFSRNSHYISYHVSNYFSIGNTRGTFNSQICTTAKELLPSVDGSLGVPMGCHTSHYFFSNSSYHLAKASHFRVFSWLRK